MKTHIELYSKVYFLTPEEGGRETPVFSGYKPSIFFGDLGTLSRIHIEGKKENDLVPLGKSYDVKVILNYRAELDYALTQGQSFELREGLKVVAAGIIE
jgi:elongation factor Tu